MDLIENVPLQCLLHCSPVFECVCVKVKKKFFKENGYTLFELFEGAQLQCVSKSFCKVQK